MADDTRYRGAKVASATLLGWMSAADKVKLDSLTAAAEIYVHPTTDGNKHLPANGTTNSGKVPVAGAVAGAWTLETITNLPTVNTAGLALFNAFIAGGTNGQHFTMNSDGTGSWKTI